MTIRNTADITAGQGSYTSLQHGKGLSQAQRAFHLVVMGRKSTRRAPAKGAWEGVAASEVAAGNADGNLEEDEALRDRGWISETAGASQRHQRRVHCSRGLIIIIAIVLRVLPHRKNITIHSTLGIVSATGRRAWCPGAPHRSSAVSPGVEARRRLQAPGQMPTVELIVTRRPMMLEDESSLVKSSVLGRRPALRRCVRPTCQTEQCRGRLQWSVASTAHAFVVPSSLSSCLSAPRRSSIAFSGFLFVTSCISVLLVRCHHGRQLRLLIPCLAPGASQALCFHRHLRI